jgi:glycine/D-amino acid oxidase-like deaminating enzyme
VSPPVDPVASDPMLPARAEVVVIGGGIIGASTAFFLAQAGIPTLLCEKGAIAGEQSSRNWGWCRAMGRDPREIPLAMESLKIWRRMRELVEADVGFRQIGTMYLGPDEREIAKLEAWLPHAKANGLDTRLLSGGEVANLLTGSVKRWAGGLHTPSDGVAEPRKAAPAIALAARRFGAAVMTNCAVRGIERAGGRVAGVITEKGTVACGSVVLAGGVWSRLFLKSLGVDLPQLKVLASVFRTGPVEGGPDIAAWGPGLAFRRHEDGGYTVSHGKAVADLVPDSFRLMFQFLPVLRAEWETIRPRLGWRFVEEWRLERPWKMDEISPFERVRVLDPLPIAEHLAAARRNLDSQYPAFGTVPTVASWGGMIDVTPDVVPVIDGVDGLDGLFVATGFSGHGFGIGPGAGRLAADLVTGAKAIVDPAPFRLSRFSDGSRPRPATGL